MKTRTLWKKIGCGFIAIGVLGGVRASAGWCADAASFQTPEYYASTGLDLLNAADAYARGYTGKGITLGICDEYVLFSHPEFAGKKQSGYTNDGPAADYDWLAHGHGTHVAGIMAADKDNTGMHGAAFDAELLSADVFNDRLGNKYAAFNRNDQVRVINNSWGYMEYIDVRNGGSTGLRNWMNSNNADVYPTLRKSILDYDKVLVFAACNSGHESPGAASLLPYLYPETAGNFINVVAVDSAAFSANKTETNAIAIFSDLSKYVEENSLAAPGFAINSLYSAGGYSQDFGTSMAAPYVTAVGGLVQQAFPYMTGRQLVDTLLSTANNSFPLPKYTLTIQMDGDQRRIKLYYFGGKPAEADIITDLKAYYAKNEAVLKGPYNYSEADFVALARDVYGDTPREMVFGQGLPDAGKAVNGPGLFNARRMDSSSFSPAAAYGKEQAMYAVDTQGYNSVWSNNIAEKRASLLSAVSPCADLRNLYQYYLQGDAIYHFSQGQEYIDTYNARATANGLLDLPVGLYKKGEGTLTLTGANTYTGSSVAAGGMLQIDGSIAGDAYSVLAGTIAGSGTINSNLYNHSVLQAGSYGAPGTLHVAGNLISDGQLAVAVQNNVAGKVAVTGTAAVEGTSFAAVPGSTYQPDGAYAVLSAANISGNFVSGAFTGLLNASASYDSARTSAFLRLSRSDTLPGGDLKQQTAYASMNAMYDALAGQTAQQQMNGLYSLDATAAAETLTAIYGGAQLNQSMVVQRSGALSNALMARLDFVGQTYPVAVEIPVNGLTETNVTAKTVIPLQLDDNNGWWMKFTQSEGHLDSIDKQPEITSQGWGVTVGRDWQHTPQWRTGWVVGYEKDDSSSSNYRNATDDYR